MTADTLHFQTFHVTTHPSQGVTHVSALRQVLKAQGLDGFIVPHEDEHQNEYLPEANERLAWVSGFTGSAGAAIIMQNCAVLFADGRYTLQSREQTDQTVFEVAEFTHTALSDFILSLPEGAVLGYDPRLHSPSALKGLKSAADSCGVALEAKDINPIDLAWGKARPPQPMAPIVPQPLEYAGIDSADKRKTLSLNLKSQGLKAALITAPSSLAWVFNIRGGDVIRTPLPLGQALLFDDGRAELFIDPKKVTAGLKGWLGPEVTLLNPDEIITSFNALKGERVSIDPNLSSAYWLETLTKAQALPILGDDPCLLPKACKNTAELKSTTSAHIRDGAILTTFLHWLATEAQTTLPSEIEVAQKLEALRIASGLVKDLSFDTISGFGPHGALPHYRVTDLSNIRCETGNLLLVDSGAQYVDGTTDVTRTVAIGEPSCEHKRVFTLVLQGHIALATVRFPLGTTGTHLDVLARQFLWSQGFDYDHGTGHGVGVYLGVHEGPQRISKALNAYALQPGMIVSNEPGFYKSGDFGIRIENLQYVTPPRAISGGERPMLGFRNLTWAPIDRSLIEVSMLSASERAYMDAYHAEVLSLIGPHISPEVKAWLNEVCAPL
jgi:Xaa-Pro aminopeptidase